MRINKFVAQSTGLSRRRSDELIINGSILINDHVAKLGETVTKDDIVKLNDKVLSVSESNTLLLLNKPPGYICSRNAQGGTSVYNLIPEEYKHLKTVGRLDKESSGLILFTDDGKLAYSLTHPKFFKKKVYHVRLNKSLKPEDRLKLQAGIDLSDGISKLEIKNISLNSKLIEVTIYEGRNRQIRRTFNHLGYKIVFLHRTKFGIYSLGKLKQGEYKIV